MTDYLLSTDPTITNFQPSDFFNRGDQFRDDVGPSNQLVIEQVGSNVTITDPIGSATAAPGHHATIQNFSITEISTADFQNVFDNSLILAGDNSSNQGGYFGGGPSQDRLGNTLNGSSLGDYINGLGGNDYINGHDGNDTIIDQAGSSTIYGGKGADDITVTGVGNKFVSGDLGDDHIHGVLSSTPGTTDGDSTISGGGGNDRIDMRGSTSHLTIYGDNVPAPGQNVNQGSDGNDTIYGGSGGDTIRGGGGNDTIYGGSIASNGVIAGTSDFINGNSGDDKIYGGAGNDIIHGGSGNDTLYGGGGGDTLYGDQGFNTFGYTGSDAASVSAETGTTTGTADTIMDFVSGNDHIASALGAGHTSGPGSAGSFVKFTDGGVNSVEAAASVAQAYGQGAHGPSTYTFIAGATDGYLVLNAPASSSGTPGPDGTVDGVITLTGHNTLASFHAYDIVGGPAAITPFVG